MVSAQVSIFSAVHYGTHHVSGFALLSTRQNFYQPGPLPGVYYVTPHSLCNPTSGHSYK